MCIVQVIDTPIFSLEISYAPLDRFDYIAIARNRGLRDVSLLKVGDYPRRIGFGVCENRTTGGSNHIAPLILYTN